MSKSDLGVEQWTVYPNRAREKFGFPRFLKGYIGKHLFVHGKPDSVWAQNR
jgi:hypothetical protein